MGFFKDTRETQRLSKELSRDWDPAAQMREGAAIMRRMTQLLQEQADVRATGTNAVPARATILIVTNTGSRLTSNPCFRSTCSSRSRGSHPSRACCARPSRSEIAGLRPGQEIAVRVNRTPPHQVIPPWVTPVMLTPSLWKE